MANATPSQSLRQLQPHDLQIKSNKLSFELFNIQNKVIRDQKFVLTFYMRPARKA